MANYVKVESNNSPPTHPSQRNSITPPSPKAVDVFKQQMIANQIDREQRNKDMVSDLQVFVDSGDYINFWQKAKEYNDPLAQLALDFHGSLFGNTFPTRIAVSKLELAFTGGDTRLRYNELAELKAIVGEGLMVKHFEALKKDIVQKRGIPGVLSVRQIDEYHYKYFDEIGLPPRTYGGWLVPGDLYCSDCDSIYE